MAHAVCDHRHADSGSINHSRGKNRSYGRSAIFHRHIASRHVLQPEFDIIEHGLSLFKHVVHSNAEGRQTSCSIRQDIDSLLQAVGPVATLLACWSMGIRNPEPSLKVLVTVDRKSVV